MTNLQMTTLLFCKEMMTLKFVEFQEDNYVNDEDKPELQSDSESEDKYDNNPDAGKLLMISGIMTGTFPHQLK